VVQGAGGAPSVYTFPKSGLCLKKQIAPLLSPPQELRKYRANIPVIVVANKIDVDYGVTQKSFGFPQKYGLPFYFVSASDGTNVVKVRLCRPFAGRQGRVCVRAPTHTPFSSHLSTPPQVFNEAIANAVHYKANSDDFVDQVMELLHEDGFGGDN
jgi:Rab-like protein 2